MNENSKKFSEEVNAESNNILTKESNSEDLKIQKLQLFIHKLIEEYQKLKNKYIELKTRVKYLEDRNKELYSQNQSLKTKVLFLETLRKSSTNTRNDDDELYNC